MSTRSRIGLQLADESIFSVYCHWDGYPEFNGVKLVENFNTREKVEALVDLGDISALWTNLGWNNETLPEAKIALLLLMLTSMITLLMVRSMLTSIL